MPCHDGTALASSAAEATALSLTFMTFSLRTLHHRCLAAILIVAAICTNVPTTFAASRLKDIVDFEGVRQNMLVGYGLVVGLNGTGDTLNNSPFTQQSLIGMLERL